MNTQPFNSQDLQDILGNVKILDLKQEKCIKTCFCNNQRQFLAILQPCHHEMCTDCLDLYYDSCSTGYFNCPRCHKEVVDVKLS